MIRPFNEQFDAELRQTFEEVVGLCLSEEQCDQATMGLGFSGCGLCRASDVADAAYIAFALK